MFLYTQNSTLGIVRINTGGTKQIQVLQKLSATTSDNTQKCSAGDIEAIHVTQELILPS